MIATKMIGLTDGEKWLSPDVGERYFNMKHQMFALHFKTKKNAKEWLSEQNHNSSFPIAKSVDVSALKARVIKREKI